MRIEKPLTIVFVNDGKIQTHLYPSEGGYQQYGILVADIVRHAAKAFNVDQNDVWEWVDKERDHPTSEIEEIKPN
jgi:hypothetical protein